MTLTNSGKRPSKDVYFLNIAFETSRRATCARRHVGAVLVKRGFIVSTGYNGSPPGMDHCTDDGCLMHEGNCIRTVHAELNALLHSYERGDTLYCTDQPCLTCLKAAISHGVERVVYCRPYLSKERDLFITAAAPNIELVQLDRENADDL